MSGIKDVDAIDEESVLMSAPGKTSWSSGTKRPFLKAFVASVSHAGLEHPVEVSVKIPDEHSMSVISSVVIICLMVGFLTLFLWNALK